MNVGKRLEGRKVDDWDGKEEEGGGEKKIRMHC